MELDVTINLRMAKLQDLEVINQYWWFLIQNQRLFDDRIIESEINQSRSMNFLREKISQGSLYVAESKENELLGIGSVTRDLHFLQTKIDVWNISDIWVRVEYRRMNIATKMVKLLEKIAFESGAEEIRLTVYSGNEPAINLYSNLGYNQLITTFSKYNLS
tara:strand:- start:9 stop:491 length:483 start_codon:yes stop_codon:yes gene_type:complete